MVMRSILSLMRPITHSLYRVPVQTTCICKASAMHSDRFVYSLVKVPFVGIKTSIEKEKVPVLDKSKAKLILKMNFQSPEDALPFYKAPIKTLVHIYNTIKNDEKKGYCKNRLYYIANRIKCPPSVLSERLVKRSFVYSLSFDWLEKALDVLIEMQVDTDRILRDLWVLKYHHETIRERLQRVKDLGVEKLFPWMVRCSEEVLTRYIQISQATKDILGETKTRKIYLANRLNVSVEEVEVMCTKLPSLKTIRVTKVKDFIDFLLKEGYEIEEIANTPRILCASQKTVMQRLQHLRLLGLNQINLNILCRSRKGFKKFCDSIECIHAEFKSTNG